MSLCLAKKTHSTCSVSLIAFKPVVRLWSATCIVWAQLLHAWWHVRLPYTPPHRHGRAIGEVGDVHDPLWDSSFAHFMKWNYSSQNSGFEHGKGFLSVTAISLAPKLPSFSNLWTWRIKGKSSKTMGELELWIYTFASKCLDHSNSPPSRQSVVSPTIILSATFEGRMTVCCFWAKRLC